MFKPASSTLRTLSRTLPAIVGRRKLATAASRASTTSRRTAATTAGVLLTGFVGYQWAAHAEARAEAPLWAKDEEKAKVDNRLAMEEERRKMQLSSQHVQVKNSLQKPGVYVWGNNVGRVVAPDSDDKVVKAPRRLAFFDNMLLRDLKLCKDAGVAVTEKGDLVQWGTGYAPDCRQPELTLRGKNIDHVSLTTNRIIALSKDKTVYSLPLEKRYQAEGAKLKEASWVPGLSSDAPISYRVLKPELSYFESVVDIATGLDHTLLLTSHGRVFSAAASFTYPSRGQLGIRGLTWATRPVGRPYDTCNEVLLPSSSSIAEVAAGDYHSVLRDRDGRVIVFGDNTNGQLGFEFNLDANILDEPTPLPIAELYPEKDLATRVTGIAAGGANTFFMVDVDDRRNGRTTADVLACGTGIFGNLGNGRWTHVQGVPTKIKALSGLVEYDEKTSRLAPIRIASLAVGATHSAAVMSNAASTHTTDYNYGRDVLWWGNNEFYQLGSRRRSNSNVPIYIPPLDPMPSDMLSSDGSGGGGGGEFTGSSSRRDMGRESGLIGGVTAGESSARATAKDQVHRLQLAPEGRTGAGKKAEQRVACGRGTTAVWSATV